MGPARPRAEKLFSKPLPVATPAAPVKTEHRFRALGHSAPVKCVLDSGGAAIVQARILCLEAFVKPTKPNKTKEGEKTLSSTDLSAFDLPQHMFSDHCQSAPENCRKEF